MAPLGPWRLCGISPARRHWATYDLHLTGTGLSLSNLACTVTRSVPLMCLYGTIKRLPSPPLPIFVSRNSMLRKHQLPQTAAHLPNFFPPRKTCIHKSLSPFPSFTSIVPILHPIFPTSPSRDPSQPPPTNQHSLSLLPSLPPPQPRPNNLPNNLLPPNNITLPLNPPPRLNLEHHRPRPPLLVNHRQPARPRAPRLHRLHHQPRRLARRLLGR